MTTTEKKDDKKEVKLKISAESVDIFDCHDCSTELDSSGHNFFTQLACNDCGSEQTVPGRIGHFLVYKVLGRGAISVVFQAKDTRDDRMLALKVSHRLGVKPTEFYDEYLREAKATTFLNHPNIIEVYDYGFTNKYPYIAMEMILGGTLKEMINNDVFLSEKQVLAMAHDISSGLHAAQLAGIIHGDLKPANILCKPDGQGYKIADFGNFNTKGTARDENLKIFGTPYYIAPEKVQHKVEDHRSDIYSLGATLWHALAGYPPHEGKTVKEVVRAHLNDKSADLQHANPTISDSTTDLVKKMMAPDPKDRFDGYTALIAAIEAAQAKLNNR